MTDDRRGQLFDCIGDGVVVLDATTMAIYDVNQRLLLLLDTERSVLVDAPITQLDGNGSTFRQAAINGLAREAREHGVARFEGVIGTPDGNAVAVTNTLTATTQDGAELLVVTLHKRPEQPSRLQGIKEEITDQRDGRESYQELFENTTDCVVEIELDDGESVITRVNAAFKNVFGYSEAEACGANIHDLLTPDEHRDNAMAIKREYEQGNQPVVEVVRETADGQREFLMRAINFGGQFYYVIYTDITERKERERELEEVTTRLELALEETDTGVWEWDLATDAVSWDETSERLFGYDPGMFPDEFQEFADRVPDEDLQRIETRVDHAIETGEQYQAEFRVQLPDGETRWIQARGIIEYNDDEEPERLLGVQTDITEIKEYEQELEDQRNKLEILNHVLRHDIRNDLQLVEGYVDTFVAQQNQQDEHGYIGTIQKSVTHAIELTETARELADVILSTQSDTEHVNLKGVLQTEIREVRSSYPGATVNRTTSIPSVEIAATGMISSVFRNILKNAIRHNNKEAAEVDVTVAEQTETVAVQIADNGPGISDRQKETVFGKGEQGLNSP